MGAHCIFTLSVLMWLVMSGNAASLPESDAGNKTLSLALLIPDAAGNRCASAIVLALEEGDRLQLLPGYEINWTMYSTGCSSYTGEAYTGMVLLKEHMAWLYN